MLFRRKTKKETAPPQEQVTTFAPEEAVSAEELAALGIEPDEQTLPAEPAEEASPAPEETVMPEPAEEETPVQEETAPAEEEQLPEEPAAAPVPETPAEQPKMTFFGSLGKRIRDAMGGGEDLTDDFFEEMEEIFITSDIGMDTTVELVQTMQLVAKYDHIRKVNKMKDVIKKAIMARVDKGDRHKMSEKMPLIILMIGINGGGKTTTIGKLGAKYLREGKSVLFVAGDTFRAAAGEQLSIWADRAGIPMISHAEGADPSAVLYDGLEAAKARGTDVIICDTAGRLQNKKNLMAELEKMNRIIDKQYPEASRETLLVLDATTGKNAISQVEQFGDVAALTGVVITKLDGTAKGGIAITIADQFDLPIKFIGVGEGINDLREFDPAAFVGGIFDE
jgi:fused signal recognition particle receptor